MHTFRLAKTKIFLFYLRWFLATNWHQKNSMKKMFVLLIQGCFMLSLQNDTNEVITETLQELTFDHEEADTFISLHAKHASTAFPPIIVKTPHTGAFLLYLAQQHELRADLYMETCRSSCLVSDQWQRNLNQLFQELWMYLLVVIILFSGKGENKTFGVDERNRGVCAHSQTLWMQLESDKILVPVT